MLQLDREILDAIRDTIAKASSACSSSAQSSKVTKSEFINAVAKVMTLDSPSVDYQSTSYDYSHFPSAAGGGSGSGSGNGSGTSSSSSGTSSFLSSNDAVKSYENFLLLLARVFDLANIDSNRHLLWKDFTNYIVRSGRFNLTPNSRHVILSYMPSKTAWSYILPLAKVVTIPNLNMMLTSDSNSTKLRLFRSDLRQHRVVHVYKELKAMVHEQRTAAQATMSRREKYIKSKTKNHKSLTTTDNAVVLAIAFAEKRHLIVVSTSDALLVSIGYAPDQRDEFSVLNYATTSSQQVPVN